MGCVESTETSSKTQRNNQNRSTEDDDPSSPSSFREANFDVRDIDSPFTGVADAFQEDLPGMVESEAVFEGGPMAESSSSSDGMVISGSRMTLGLSSLLSASASASQNGEGGGDSTSQYGESLSTLSLLQPIDLPAGYLERRHSDVRPLERKGTGIPRPAKAEPPVLPIHWASRFLPRDRGCLHDLHYKGAFSNPELPTEVCIAPPLQRRAAMVEEILNEKPEGKGFAWPHPRPNDDGQLLLLPLSAIKNEQPSFIRLSLRRRSSVGSMQSATAHLDQSSSGRSTGSASSRNKNMMVRRQLKCIKGHMSTIRRRLQSPPALIPLDTQLVAETCVELAIEAGLMQLAAVFIALQACLSDLELFLRNPSTFSSYMEQSIGSHYLDEARARQEEASSSSVVEDDSSRNPMLQELTCDAVDGPQGGKEGLEDTICRWFHEDASYCFMVGRCLMAEKLAGGGQKIVRFDPMESPAIQHSI